MPLPQPGLVLPTSIDRAARRLGCGCCAHCQCLGHCVEVDYTPNGKHALSPNHVSRPPSPLLPPTVATNGGPKKKDFLSAMEKVPHPNDVVSLSRKSSRNAAVDGPQTPAVPNRREGHSRNNSSNGYLAGNLGGPEERAQRYKEGRASRAASPDGRREPMYDEYERGYASHAREHRKQTVDRGEAEQDDRKGRRMAEEREGESRARSKSRGREPSKQQGTEEPASRGAKPDTVSISLGPITLTRTRSRTEGDAGTDAPTTKTASKRELIKELIKGSAPIPVNPPTYQKAPTPAPLPYSMPVMDPPRGIEVPGMDDARYGSFNAIKKLTVHVASDYGLMLHFLDWSRRNDANEPLVAYRLEDGVQGAYEKKASGHHFSRKQGMDWLQESHENGAKVKNRLSLGVGVRGPLLFHIDVKQRKVDKFVITGTQDHAPRFKNSCHYGEHDDYRHVYFETPDGRTLKWHLAEPGKLMRLYGRGEKDYGKVYAEARTQRVDHRKHRTPKDTQIYFFDPNRDPYYPDTAGEASELDIDFAFLCASWWCARQTFDESRVVEAHAEVELIENIEKAFEVDLLAGA